MVGAPGMGRSFRFSGKFISATPVMVVGFAVFVVALNLR